LLKPNEKEKNSVWVNLLEEARRTMDGNLDLRSGNWRWNVIEVKHMPSGEVSNRYISLHLEKHPGSHMHVILGPEEQVDSENLKVVSRHPHQRELVDPESKRWTFFPVRMKSDRPGVVFHSDMNECGYGDLPSLVSLGEATDSELLQIVGA
jgi:hypothetical protein